MTMSIEEQMSRETISWRPDLDDNDHPKVIVGEIIEITEGESGYGPYPILTVAPKDNSKILWRWVALGGVAQGRLEKLSPQESEEIGIRYLGTKPSKNYPGKSYADWDIRMGERKAVPAATPAPPSDGARPGDKARAEADVKQQDDDGMPSDPPGWLDEEPF